MPSTRREALQRIAALGAGGAASLLGDPQLPAPLEPCAPVPGAPPLAPDQLAIAHRALRRNLEAFEAVRRLEIDDAIPPAVTFAARAPQR